METMSVSTVSLPPPLPPKTRKKPPLPARTGVGDFASLRPPLTGLPAVSQPSAAAHTQHVVSIRIREQSADGCVRICVGPEDHAMGGMVRAPDPGDPDHDETDPDRDPGSFFYHSSGQSSPSGPDSDADVCPKSCGVTVRVTVNGNPTGAGSVSSGPEEHDSEDERSSNISCDSLNSCDFLPGMPARPARPPVRGQYIVTPPPLPEKKALRPPPVPAHTPALSPLPTRPRVAVEQKTYEERKADTPPAPSTPTPPASFDQYYDFHLNEKECLLEPVGNGVGQDEDTFAGCRDYGESAPETTAIRSSKGTIRGVRNRVRAGVATFLQMQTTKSWKDKEAGKVVVFVTTMGVVRTTHQRCVRVKQILRTLLVRFEERDVFMSRELQAELLERTGHSSVQLPQVFVEGQHVGDADTIERLNESGELRKMLKPYKSLDACSTCGVCGGFRLLPCAVCNGSKKSVHRNHFTAELVALRCMNCDEVGLVKCTAC